MFKNTLKIEAKRQAPQSKRAIISHEERYDLIAEAARSIARRKSYENDSEPYFFDSDLEMDLTQLFN